jgi:hypothetical protein
MPSDSGTPTDWLAAPSHNLVNVHCVCDPEIATSRFLHRQRHPGHLDGELTSTEVLARLREIAKLPPLDIGKRIEVDTSGVPNLTDVVREVRAALKLLT